MYEVGICMQYIDYKSIMKAYFSKLFLIIAIGRIVWSEPSDDSIIKIPGYPKEFTNRAFAGYLETESNLRSLHYIFVESNSGANNSDPIVLWLNGGPGCTSKIGFIQQIMPYCLNESSEYIPDATLPFNQYGWLNLTNLLFIDTPAGVGYSINNDSKYQFNDVNTAKDNVFALKYFFSNKFPFYAKSIFYIAGESYAGKYVPDLAMKILYQNEKTPEKKIDLRGILLANPIISFEGLQENRVDYLINRNFIDPKLIPYWERSCKTDSQSAGCNFFYEKYQDLVYRIDEYNIYGQCYGRKGPPQQSLMAQLSLRMSKFHSISKRYAQRSQYLRADQWCTYSQGVERYLKTNAQALNSKKLQMDIPSCNLTIFESYKVNPQGSLVEIPALLQKKVKVYILNGDWDDVVPFTDNYKNFNKMGLRLQGNVVPWLINDNKDHAGFIRKYSYGLTFYLVKGAGHMVPLYQRERSYRIFQKFIYDK